MILFDIRDHYWDFGKTVFSSKRRAMVPRDDAEFLAWLGDGLRAPTVAPAGGEAELRAMTRVLIPQITIIARLHAANKFAAAARALKSNDYLYHRWIAADGIATDDPDALALLAAIGVDSSVILAPT